MVRAGAIKASVYHQEIMQEIEAQAARAKVPRLALDLYTGTGKPNYALKTASLGQMVRDWLGRHPDLTPSEYEGLLGALSHGTTYNEFIFVGLLLRHRPDLRQTLDPQCLDDWLEYAQGWAEVDSLCQSVFTADEMLARWKEWKRLLVGLRASPNVHKRRASLVLLTWPVRERPDPRLARLAFANIVRLQRDPDILITKAISWLLRNLSKHHRAEVEDFLRDHVDALPRVALREVRHKLDTGVRSGQSRKSQKQKAKRYLRCNT
jgi:3-methyladenine DNA glycosylase AlkD